MNPDYHLDTLQRISLQMTTTLDLKQTLGAITAGLVEDFDAVFSRVWLIQPGDICDVCFKSEHCSDRTNCLHLTTSAGLYGDDPEDLFRRVPVGAFKIGRIAAEREPVQTTDVQNDPRIQDPAWARELGLVSFAGYPLVFNDRLLGVLAMFTRFHLSKEAFDALGLFASQAAMAIENAMLFTEVNDLKERLEAENLYLQEEVDLVHEFDEIIGSSPALVEMLRLVEQVAPTDSTVLFEGEGGVGKEIIARATHKLSHRADRPFIKINCGAISKDQAEVDLFGKAASGPSGVQTIQRGRFELADGGTLFLDEVADLSMNLQVKLLRAIQEGEFEPLGSRETVKADIRVIAATSRRLKEEVEAKRFRSDLYYKLSVFPIPVPPLRSRKGDIPALVKYFVQKNAVALGKPLRGVSRKGMRQLTRYDWPGNIRELQNIIERASILASGPVVDIDSLIPSLDPKPDDTLLTLNQVERKHITAVLEKYGWVVEGRKGAAGPLGMHPNTLRSRMKKLGIRRP